MKHVLEFDGGTPCNVPSRGYGIGYGSFKIDNEPIRKISFGVPMSANCAEILILASGLKQIKATHGRSYVLARGDSQVAINWIEKMKKKPLPLHKNATQPFKSAVYELQDAISKHLNVIGEWRGRTHSVTLFGH